MPGVSLSRCREVSWHWDGASSDRATSVDDAKRVLRAAQETGRKLGVSFMTRHFAASQEARRIIQSGAIGDVLVIQCEMSSGGANPPLGWRLDPQLAQAGVLNAIGV